MARSYRDITDAELAVMQVLWERGESSIRQICHVLYPGGGPSQYATVQKLLERLEAKDFVYRDRTQQVHLFRPALGREELIGRRLRSLAEQLCGGSLTPLLTHLVKTKALTPQERAELRALIEQSENTPRRRGSKG
ncbi:MAG: BlaI/MecI/CopY family transcriptional regulator [Gemmatales bacterium]|nr:BlaI/MecI/CopY family transcriptional regulator [Gemmatales bacterium]MDW8387980.1 BlaI/MecI/CopY family transcriptional regulator [Gemmatales bacterium]